MRLIIFILNNAQHFKHDKFPAKVAEYLPWKKLFVYLIDHMDLKNTYIQYRKKLEKEI